MSIANNDVVVVVVVVDSPELMPDAMHVPLSLSMKNPSTDQVSAAQWYAVFPVHRQQLAFLLGDWQSAPSN
jgi:hypothetical protein